MAKKQTIAEITAVFQDQARCLRELAVEVSQIGSRLTKMNGRLDRITRNLDLPDESSVGSASGDRESATTVNRGTQFSTSPCTCKIIPFSGTDPSLFSSIKSNDASGEFSQPLTLFPAAPGQPLSPELPDFRSVLQRDGLILLAWDRRDTEKGECYTAYWVTSAGIPRFYASRPLPAPEFSSAKPDHKSYAAEDGIEFYGQAAPLYMVHVAPELMMSNPQHGELRVAHIKKLKELGSTADFTYKYLLTTEKNREMPHGKSRDESHHQAG